VTMDKAISSQCAGEQHSTPQMENEIEMMLAVLKRERERSEAGLAVVVVVRKRVLTLRMRQGRHGRRQCASVHIYSPPPNASSAFSKHAALPEDIFLSLGEEQQEKGQNLRYGSLPRSRSTLVHVPGPVGKLYPTDCEAR
jgi:hypothetical protein